MIEHDLRALHYLRRLLPDEWDRAADVASQLAEDIRYLPWADRARSIDAFVWHEARARLTKEDVTAIVNRQAASVAEPGRVDSYLRFCRGVVTTILLLLDDAAQVEHEAAALMHFFSLEDRHQEAAVAWIGDGHHERLAASLPSWPGCAFVLLILSPSDSAESFLARDAFWAAMLGHG